MPAIGRVVQSGAGVVRWLARSLTSGENTVARDDVPRMARPRDCLRHCPTSGMSPAGNRAACDWRDNEDE